MPTVADLNKFMAEFAPPDLAEDWDNVGLLVGDPNTTINKVMTCLTVTPESVDEAIKQGANVIVTHHPLPFHGMKRLTSDQTPGRLLLQLIKAEVAIISPHTAFDSAAEGINQMLTERFRLSHSRPLVPASTYQPNVGSARIADTQQTTKLADLIATAKKIFDLEHIQFVGDESQTISQVAFACGSGGSFMDQAIRAGCDAFVTGETNFHTCLEAKATGIGLILLGHFSSERFAVEVLSERIQQAFVDVRVWASKQEMDPVSVS